MLKKLCNKCKELKLHNEFYKDRRTSTGLYSSCKECHRNYRRDYIKHLLSEKEKRYKKGFMVSRRIKYRTRYSKEQKHAWSVLNHKITDGTIIRPDKCVVPECLGKKIEGHHDDYNRPLDVLWLCKKHHEDKHHQPLNQFKPKDL